MSLEEDLGHPEGRMPREDGERRAHREAAMPQRRQRPERRVCQPRRSAAAEARERRGAQAPSEPPEGPKPCQCPDFRLPASPAVRELIPVVSSHPAHATLLWQPQTLVGMAHL